MTHTKNSDPCAANVTDDGHRRSWQELCEENTKLKASLAAVHCRINHSPVSESARMALSDECEHALPDLKKLRKI